uniref:SJCHGC09796 protein n=1 Tax=Schistosoma japonicum TaxID=6182 RepID=Q5BQV3_SCHJA|nr:SJCHGC09796 protein [Schistosoma japonicum]
MHWPCSSGRECKEYFIYPNGRNAHRLGCNYALKRRINRWTMVIKKKCAFVQERNYFTYDDEIGCVKLSRTGVMTYCIILN